MKALTLTLMAALTLMTTAAHALSVTGGQWEVKPCGKVYFKQNEVRDNTSTAYFPSRRGNSTGSSSGSVESVY